MYINIKLVNLGIRIMYMITVIIHYEHDKMIFIVNLSQ